MISAARGHRRRAVGSTLIVGLERANTPVRLLVKSRVLSDVLLTRSHATKPVVHRAARLLVNDACPVAAEGVGEDETLVHETLFNVAVALEASRGSAELSGVGLAGGEALWRAATGEEPDLDAVILPLGNVVTTAVGVETRTVGGGPGVAHVTTSSTGRVEGAVCRGQSAGLVQAVHLTLSISVEG